MSHAHESMPVTVFSSSYNASVHVAKEIAELIRDRQKEGKTAVLGLATGSTPCEVYNELVRMHKEEGLSFQNVISFNLDEYFPMQPHSIHSYWRFMNEHLFDHIDIKKENVHIPIGTLAKEKVNEWCKEYEALIEKVGGLDLQILGIGRTGHIGFNEPGSSLNSKTRMIRLDHITRNDAASGFFGEKNVPLWAITMGIGTIMKARKIFLLAFGEGKSSIIKKTVEGPVNDQVPATFLQGHPNISVILNDSSAAELTRCKTPWLVSDVVWDERMIRKAVVWLCGVVDLPILKLTERHYMDNGMSDLISHVGSAYDINIRVFNDLQHTITGWPGGKKNADDSQRPERALPYPKKVIVFSPHPDDDAISMGGTLSRLVQQGHECHVAYQTTGSIAVHDDDVLRYLDFLIDMDKYFGNSKTGTPPTFSNETVLKVKAYILEKMQGKHAAENDPPELLRLKTMIRAGEAKSACRSIKMNDENCEFFEMPFYETGAVKKKPLSEEDIKIVTNYMRKIKPHQIYAAGDLTDPHGTHMVCFNAIVAALKIVKNEDWMKECRVWLYRGAWQEWDIDQVDMAVPLSPDEVVTKRQMIFKHQSQKDKPLFPGSDSREFWQRSEARNKNTAVTYDKLGLAEYQAIECFARFTDF